MTECRGSCGAGRRGGGDSTRFGPPRRRFRRFGGRHDATWDINAAAGSAPHGERAGCVRCVGGVLRGRAVWADVLWGVRRERRRVLWCVLW